MKWAVFMQIGLIQAVDYGPTSDQSWTPSTHLLFRLAISGYGLSSSDTIRLVEPGHSCIEDSGNVKSADSTIQWNCPDILDGCTSIRVNPPIDIPVAVVGWNCNEFDDYNNCLSTVDMTGVQVDADGTVRLQFSSPPNIRAGDYIRLGAGVVCQADCDVTQLNILKGGVSDSSSNDFKIGHEVFVDPSDPPTTLRLHIESFALPTPPSFTLAVGASLIEWYKTSAIFTRVELKGRLERSQVKVCWNGGGKPGGYTLAAGALDILDAPIMASTELIPVTTTFDRAVTPIIVRFSTTAASAYSSRSLVLGIHNPSELSVVHRDGSLLSESSIISQVTCGDVFSELSSGFPQPKGCFVTEAVLNASVIGMEIHIVFHDDNGLKPGTDYQFVVHVIMYAVRAASTTPCCGSNTCGSVTDSVEVRGCQYITLTSLSSDPFRAIEIGRPLLVDRFPVAITRTVSDAFLTSARLSGGIGNVVELLTGDSVVVELVGGDGTSSGPISAGFIVRVIFEPFTAWRLRNSCSATVSDGSGVGFSGSADSCSSQDGYSVLVKLPAGMPDFTSPAALKLEIFGLVAPEIGSFPAPLGVEIFNAAGSRPYYVETSVGEAFVDAHPRGSVVAESAVTDFSFPGETGRKVVINVIPGVRLDSGAVLAITLPAGWTCVSATNVAADAAFWASVLGNPDPSGRGTADGVWNACSLTVGGTIFASSSLFFELTMNYPLFSATLDVTRFRITVSQGGRDFGPSEFEAAEDSLGFVRSFPILGELGDVHIEPVGAWSGAGVRVAVFFTPATSVTGGFVRVTVPAGTVTASPCTAFHLFDYVYATSESVSVSRVPGLSFTCETVDGKTWIAFSGQLVTGVKYAFGLVVDVTNSDGRWVLRTADAHRNLVDGSRESIVPFIAGGLDSFYPFTDETELAVDIADLRPFEMTGSLTTCTLTFSVPSSFTATVNARVSVPPGFEVSGPVVGASAAVLQDQGARVLLLENVQFSSGQHSISVPIKVPSRPPSEGLYGFRIEFGFDTGRVLVARSLTDAVGLVRGLNNARVTASSTIAGAENLIHFKISLHTPLTQIGGLLIEVPLEFSFDSTCDAVGLAGGSCSFSASVLDISRTDGFVPGDYDFFVRALNPATPAPLAAASGSSCGFNLCFTFHAVENRASAGSEAELALTIAGFPVTARMASAGFVTQIGTRTEFPNRDDRPQHRNSVIIYFRPLSSVTRLTVTAPAGLVFDAACAVNVHPNDVFGGGIPWPPGYDIWPPAAEPTCVGWANVAIIDFAQAAPAPTFPYAIRIGIAENPKSYSTVYSQWTLLAGDAEASDPFESFPLWTFQTGSGITPVSRGVGASLVTITVKPFTALPGGSFRVTAPTGFQVPANACAKVRASPGSLTSCTASAASVEIGMDEILNSATYTLVIPIENPSVVDLYAVWLVESFSTHVGDASTFPAYATVATPTMFSVSNFVQEGDAVMHALTFSVQAVLLVGDIVRVTPPVGLVFDCTNHVPAVCVSGSAQVVIRAATSAPIVFTVSGRNPATTPGPINQFILSLSRGGVLVEQSLAAGWEVVSKLANVELVQVGQFVAAGSLGNMDLSFTSPAVFDELEISFVTAFDFAGAALSAVVVDTLGVSRSVTVSTTLLVKGVNLKFTSVVESDSAVTVAMRDVQLPGLAGPVVVNVLVKRESVAQASRLRFAAFELPGRIQVVAKSLSSAPVAEALSQLPPNSAIAKYFLPRVGDSTQLQFVCVTSLSLPQGTVVTIRNTDYLGPSSGSTTVSLSTSVDAGDEYTVNAAVTIPGSIAAALSPFSLSITDGVLKHTNDGLTEGFAVVHPLEFEIFTPWSPPSAPITVTISLTQIGTLPVHSILVVAPQGFSFGTADCLRSSGTAGATTCTPGTVYDATRPSAIVQFATPLTSESLGRFQIGVSTPPSNPAANSWFLISRGPTETQTGWGMIAAPFAVNGMAGVEIRYSRILNVVTQVAVSFRNEVLVPKPGRLRIHHPVAFVFDCASLSLGTLPIYKDAVDVCDASASSAVLDPYIDIVFHEDLVPGEFSFAVAAMTPSETLSEPLFKLTLMDGSSNVLNALIGYVGDSLLPSNDGIHVAAAQGLEGLKWYPSVVSGSARMGIEFNFTVMQRVTLNNNGECPIAAILISCPSAFLSGIQVETDVIQSGSNSLAVDSIDFAYPDHVVVALNRSQTIEEGSYALQLPVWVPPQIPDVNIWYLSFCSGTGPCTSPADAAVITSLPQAGFLIGDVHPLTAPLDVSGAHTRVVWNAVVFSVLVFSISN